MSARMLAFDTSTEVLSVALQCDDRTFTFNGPGGAAASAQLLPRIRQMLQHCGVDLVQLQAIAFGRGPGAFTGLRTACAVAQGLALGAALPVLPLDSLMIVAEGVRVQHPDAPAEVDVIMDARMGELYAGRYAWTGAKWLVSRAPALLSLDGLHAAWARQAPRCVAGSALPVFAEKLHCRAALHIGADIDRAAALLRLAQQRWSEEGGVDAAAALPLYLRDKVALTVAEREERRRAEAGA